MEKSSSKSSGAVKRARLHVHVSRSDHPDIGKVVGVAANNSAFVVEQERERKARVERDKAAYAARLRKMQMEGRVARARRRRSVK